MEKILTIAVPMYNVERYIRQCLDSFLIDDGAEALEVLIINDGTLDSSAQIAQEYVDSYPSVYRLISKRNGGHGSAVNLGISEAKGKYFKVVDGDDWLDSVGLKKLICTLSNSNSDIVASNYYWVFDGSNKMKKEINRPFRGVEYEKEYEFIYICNDLYIKMHSMTIRTQLLQEYHVCLDENCFYVDTEYIIYPIPYVKTVTFLEECVYRYRVGLSEQSVNIYKMRERCKQHEHVLNQLIHFYEMRKSQDPQPIIRYLERGIARMVSSQIKIYLSYPASAMYRKKIRELDQKLRSDYPGIYSAMQNRFVWLLRFSGYRLYPIASYILRIKNSI